MDRPGVVFMGSPSFAVPALAALVARPDVCRVAGVVTQPDKPAGRGRRVKPPPVKIAAASHGIPVLQPAKLKAPETFAALAALSPALVVVAAYGRILPPAILALPPRGCVNVHASLLPRYRGASPIAHAILAGDATTGVSIMQMEEGLDTGPVFATRSLPIGAEDTSASLGARLAELGAGLLAELLPDLLAGRLTPAPQGAEGAGYAPLLVKDDGRLDFSRTAAELDRRVRAMNPWPLAFATRGAERVQVLAAAPVAASGEPGTVVAADAAGVVVACGAGGLRLVSVKPAGKGAMSAGAWVAGRGVAAGDRFDLPAAAPAG